MNKAEELAEQIAARYEGILHPPIECDFDGDPGCICCDDPYPDEETVLQRIKIAAREVLEEELK